MTWILMVLIFRTSFVVNGGLSGEPVIIDQKTHTFSTKDECFEAINNSSASSSMQLPAISYNYGPINSGGIRSEQPRFGHLMYCYRQ